MNKLFFILLLCSSFLKPLYAQENQNNGYILKIKKGKTIKEDSNRFLKIPVTLTNTTKDTLYYTSMTCSWQEDYYTVDSSKLTVETVPCDKNIEDLLILPPSKSATVQLRLIINGTPDSTPVTFRIGFNLKKVSGKQDWLKNRKERRRIKNIIWSNEITMKL